MHDWATNLLPVSRDEARYSWSITCVFDKDDEWAVCSIKPGSCWNIFQVPQTVKNFKAMCTGEAGSSYEGTIFNRVLQGQYIQGGRQGPRDKGETSPPTKLDRNEEVVRGNSFKLRHQRPGTVSLCLSENDDEEAIKLNSDYRNVEFMITTGMDCKCLHCGFVSISFWSRIVSQLMLTAQCWMLGPGPAPQLDNGNIVFGSVLEGQFFFFGPWYSFDKRR